MTYIILVAVLCGGGALLYSVRRSSGASMSIISGRMGRYGLTSVTGNIVIAGPPSQRTGVTQGMEKMVDRAGLGMRVGSLLERANLKMTPGEFATLALALFIFGVSIGYLLLGVLGVLALGTVSLAAPHFYLRRRTSRRKRKFMGQLADMAQMMGNSMRAGFSIIQSMELVGNEGPSPASEEFERVVTEIRLGLPVDVALDHLLNRLPGEDLELMVVAINVQRQIGGNLSEILTVISETIRQRVQFEGELKTLTTQGRLSSYIVTALPVGVAVIIYLLDGPYESYLYTATLGRIMLGVSLTLIGVGFFFLNRIANIEV